jgi:hypothetical protein
MMPNEKNASSATSDLSQSENIPSIEAAEAWNNRLFGSYIVFGIFIAIAGAWFTVAVFKASNRVQEAIKADADARIESLRTEGDKARSALAKTNVRLTEAEERLAEAQRKVEEARRDTAKHELELVIQRQQLADASERVAKAESQAVEAKLELEKYRAPRMLRPDQEEAFVSAMSEFKGQRALLGAIANTSEASSFGVQLFLALTRAGVNVEGRGLYVKRVVMVARGIVVKHTTGNDKARRFAGELANALNENGILATRMGSLDEEVVERMEKEQGISRNHENFESIAIAIGDKP